MLDTARPDRLPQEYVLYAIASDRALAYAIAVVRLKRFEQTERDFSMISSSAATIHVAIQAANERFMQAFRHGDAVGLASLYTQDAQLLPPGSEAAHGWEAIRAFWQGAMDSGITAAQLEIVEVEDHGDSAIEVSQYTLLGAQEQVLDQ